jgi:hypothetical protein
LGAIGKGHRLLEAVLMDAVQYCQSPLRASFTQFSPEQDCLDVGRKQARAHFARGLVRIAALCARILLGSFTGGLQSPDKFSRG